MKLAFICVCRNIWKGQFWLKQICLPQKERQKLLAIVRKELMSIEKKVTMQQDDQYDR